jgi:Tfp pilus assembly protein PilF
VRPEVNRQLLNAVELERQGQLREAERIILNVVREAEAGGPSIELGLALNNLAVLLLTGDRFPEAERQFRRAIDVLEAVGSDAGKYLAAKTKVHLGALYLDSGRLDDAVKLDIPRLHDLLTAEEDRVLARSTLAGIAAQRRDFDTAEQINLELLAYWRHPSRAAAHQIDVATVLNNLGVIALWRGRPELARTRLEDAFAVWKNAVGPASPMVAKAMSNVGVAYMELGDFGSAALWLERSADAGRVALGDEHPLIVAVQFARAEALKKAGRRTEAKEVARIAEQGRRSLRSVSSSLHTVDYRDILKMRDSGRNRR